MEEGHEDCSALFSFLKKTGILRLAEAKIIRKYDYEKKNDKKGISSTKTEN